MRESCAGSGGVIRQSVSCDVCGTEKRQTNHWFVAREEGGELRLSGWSSRHRSRAGTKHLCGQTCLHKLVDEYMARSLMTRTQPAAGDEMETAAAPTAIDASLTSSAAHAKVESSARLLPPPVAIPVSATVPRPAAAAPAAVPAKIQIEAVIESLGGSLGDEAPNRSAREWRAEAWEREREREQRSTTRRGDLAARRS